MKPQLTQVAALLLSFATLIGTGRAQVRPLPPLSFDSLSQTYHGRLTTTLHRLFVRKDELRHYVTKDEAATHVTTTALASELSRYITKDEAANHVTSSDPRLSDARTPKGMAGGDLAGEYPNPTIKSSVNLSGSPTATTPSSSDNSTRIATTAYVQANQYNHPSYTTRTGSTGNMAPGFGQAAYTYTYNVDNTGHVTGVNTRTITIPNTTATTSSAGLMSAADKSKLDGMDMKYKLPAVFQHSINVDNYKYRFASEVFDRGGTKKTSETAYIFCLVDFINDCASIALLGRTRSSVEVNTTLHFGNYIYQLGDGWYINICNKLGMWPSRSYGYKINEEVFRCSVILPCTFTEFIDNVSRFRFF